MKAEKRRRRTLQKEAANDISHTQTKSCLTPWQAGFLPCLQPRLAHCSKDSDTSETVASRSERSSKDVFHKLQHENGTEGSIAAFIDVVAFSQGYRWLKERGHATSSYHGFTHGHFAFTESVKGPVKASRSLRNAILHEFNLRSIPCLNLHRSICPHQLGLRFVWRS